MTPEQMRVAIAESVGWRSVHTHKQTRIVLGENPIRKDDFYYDNVPDYLNNLNAMHEIEKNTTNEYWEQLAILTLTHYDFNLYGESVPASAWKDFAHATALQRAEAYLRIKGLWKE